MSLGLHVHYLEDACDYKIRFSRIEMEILLLKMKDYEVTDVQLRVWIREFVQPIAPLFFVGDNLRAYLLNRGILVYTRSEFFASFPDFVRLHGYVYHLWDVLDDVFVIQVDDEEFRSISKDVLEDIESQQRDNRRGQVYTREWIERLSDQIPNDTVLLEWVRENTNMSDMVLRFDRWSRFPDVTKHAWLRQWLDDNLEIPTQELDRGVLERLPNDSGSIVHEYAGRFSTYSGANCFAATITAAVGIRERSASLINQWLHPEPFFRMLEASGFQCVEEWRSIDESPKMRGGDVLVWQDADGKPLHASYAVDEVHVFNKMGQSWPQPWQVISIQEVVYSDVLSAGGVIYVYRLKGVI